ncbi:MAG: CbiX/SirB N-terminal domain-containing protein [Thioalkalispiraceae bacterium]|jgi:sirohydrochlorin ferrochelatase
MKSLLVIAHGSRREASNDEVRALTSRIADKAQQQFDIVESAFLELAEPSIPDGIKRCIEKGATEIVILPYFLSAGRHVAEDIPGEVDATRSQYPEIDMKIVPYLGAMEKVADLMTEQAILAVN